MAELCYLEKWIKNKMMKFNRDFSDSCTLLGINQKTLNGWMYLNKAVKNSMGIYVKLST